MRQQSEPHAQQQQSIVYPHEDNNLGLPRRSNPPYPGINTLAIVLQSSSQSLKRDLYGLGFQGNRGTIKTRPHAPQHQKKMHTAHARVPVVHLHFERRAHGDELLDAQAAVPDEQQLNFSGQRRRPDVGHLQKHGKTSGLHQHERVACKF